MPSLEFCVRSPAGPPAGNPRSAPGRRFDGARSPFADPFKQQTIKNLRIPATRPASAPPRRSVPTEGCSGSRRPPQPRFETARTVLDDDIETRFAVASQTDACEGFDGVLIEKSAQPGDIRVMREVLRAVAEYGRTTAGLWAMTKDNLAFASASSADKRKIMKAVAAFLVAAAEKVLTAVAFGCPEMSEEVNTVRDVVGFAGGCAAAGLDAVLDGQDREAERAELRHKAEFKRLQIFSRGELAKLLALYEARVQKLQVANRVLSMDIMTARKRAEDDAAVASEQLEAYRGLCVEWEHQRRVLTHNNEKLTVENSELVTLSANQKRTVCALDEEVVNVSKQLLDALSEAHAARLRVAELANRVVILQGQVANVSKAPVTVERS
ncbi:hypothetical protein DIPPA_08674 [Diplonema papillatum]|nr:hypothetical protein DIPPA_08674 [Diplonema papillatum]